MISFLGDIYLDKYIDASSIKFKKTVVFNCEHTIGADESNRVGRKIGLNTNRQRYSELFKNSKALANLANNHVFDFGQQGFRATVLRLKQDGIEVFGCSGCESAKISNVNGSIIEVISFVLPETNPIYGSKDENRSDYKIRDYLDKFNLREACLKVRESKKNSNYVVVYLHWGEEELTGPTALQREIAHLLIDSGANLIVGCHSHCVGPIETYKDSKIYYSLGNFYFPDLKVAYKEGDGTLRYIVKRQRKRNKTSLIVDIDSKFYVSHRYCSTSKDKITQIAYSDKNIWSNFPKTIERFRAKLLWNLDNPWIVIRKIKRVLRLVK